MKAYRIAGIVGAALVAATSAPVTVAAQDYPAGQITFYVPYPPGGGTDFVSRLLTENIRRQEGWVFVVENRPGAGGNIGLAELSNTEPNGLSIGMGQTSNLAINPSLYDNIPYDPIEDFTPIAIVADQPVVIVVAADSPYETFEDLVEAARENPGEISMGTSGIGTVAHLGLELFASEADVEFLHIPYSGAAPAVTDAMGGQIDFAAASAPSVLSHVRSGTIRALAVTTEERNIALPDTPSIAELGYDGFTASDWKAVVGPAGLSDETVATLNAAINEVLQTEAMIEALETEGSVPVGGSSEDFASFLAAEQERWGEIVVSSGATTD